MVLVLVEECAAFHRLRISLRLDGCGRCRRCSSRRRPRPPAARRRARAGSASRAPRTAGPVPAAASPASAAACRAAAAGATAGSSCGRADSAGTARWAGAATREDNGGRSHGETWWLGSTDRLGVVWMTWVETGEGVS